MLVARATARKMWLIALCVVLASLGYGYAAGNTVPTSNAGDGVGAVSGYTVSAIHYNLNASSPQNLSSIQFTVAPAVPVTGAVRVSIDNGTSWLAANACTVTGGTSVSCTTTSTVSSVTDLRVVAAQ